MVGRNWILAQFQKEHRPRLLLKAIELYECGRGVAWLAPRDGFIFGTITARVFEDARRIAVQRQRHWTGNTLPCRNFPSVPAARLRSSTPRHHGISTGWLTCRSSS